MLSAGQFLLATVEYGVMVHHYIMIGNTILFTDSNGQGLHAEFIKPIIHKFKTRYLSNSSNTYLGGISLAVMIFITIRLEQVDTFGMESGIIIFMPKLGIFTKTL